MKYGFDIKPIVTVEQLQAIEHKALSTGKFHAVEMYFGHDMMEMDFTDFYNSIKYLVREYMRWKAPFILSRTISSIPAKRFRKP